MIMTPIKAFMGSEDASPQRPLLCPEGKSAAPGSHLSSGGGGEAESGTSVIAEGDLTGQFTRVMGKGEQHQPGLRCRPLWLPWSDFCGLCSQTVCTQLLVSRSDEDNISSYLQLIDKCLNHEVSFLYRSLHGGWTLKKVLFVGLIVLSLASPLPRRRKRGCCHGNNKSRGCSGPFQGKPSWT